MPASGIHVVDHPGAPGADLVVLVHGTMDRSASFARAARALGELHVVTYDRRGYGRSPGTDGTGASITEHLADLVSLLDGRRATVVGHSYGGDLALLAAIHHPELVAAAGAFEPPMPWLPWWPPGSASLDVARRGLTDAGDIAEQFFRSVAGDAAWDGLPAGTQRQRRMEGPAVVADMASLTEAPGPFTLDELAAAMASGTPVGLACGSDSKPHQHDGAARLAHQLGLALTTIDGARHGGHLSHPAEFAAWVRSLVDASRTAPIRGGR